jgi:hypothetical protein
MKSFSKSIMNMMKFNFSNRNNCKIHKISCLDKVNANTNDKTKK